MAWPNLTKLKFKIIPVTSNTRTTIWGLLWLATFCRKLKSLTFNFNGTEQISPDELALAANHGSTFLDVGNSMFDELEDVVEFMSVVFPTLLEIKQLELERVYYIKVASSGGTQTQWQDEDT